MQDFIQDVASKLGVGTDTAEAATGGLLGLIKQNADGGDVSEMLGKLPGAEGLIESASAGGGGGGLLGSIGGALSGALGGGGGNALGAVEALTKGGLSMDKLGSFLSMFKQYVQPLLGADLLKRLLGSVPGLGNLLG